MRRRSRAYGLLKWLRWLLEHVRRGLLAGRLLLGGGVVSFVGDGVEIVQEDVGVKTVAKQVGGGLLRH